ncbi:MAG: GNAT family N-acetyltransferase [Anaerolineales bacterium]|nr:MAG: GNAT family N-acetyltransferase [Anaerolineales bacterium]
MKLEVQVAGIQVKVKPATKDDLLVLERAFPFGPPEKHAERLERQNRNAVVYLIAWYAGQPVGHGLLNWSGAVEEPIASYVQGLCPDVEDLFVLETYRSKSVARQIIFNAERLVRERGYPQIGLSVDVKNIRARILYKRMGYRETYLGEHYERGEYIGQNGQTQIWEETCIYLIKKLEAQNQ